MYGMGLLYGFLLYALIFTGEMERTDVGIMEGAC